MQHFTYNDVVDFSHFIESETNLYKLNFLNYYWYYTVKEELNNSTSKRVPIGFPGEHSLIRQKDYRNKKHLLEKPHDFVFFSRAKMYRENSTENVFYYDVLKYLENHGKSFLIIEERNGEPYDLRYFESEFYSHVIPYEVLFEDFKPFISKYYEPAINEYILSVEQLFSNEPLEIVQHEFSKLLYQKYIQRKTLIPHIIFRQALMNKLQAKALFGGMGTYRLAGFGGQFATVEIGHGFPGMYISNPPPPLPGLKEYQENNFRMDKHFILMPSPIEPVQAVDNICIDTNKLNYGMPELRKHLAEEQDSVKTVKNRINLNDNQVILLATTGKIDYQLFRKLVEHLLGVFPDFNILIRPHPSYEDTSESLIEGQNIQYVPFENKFNLFRIADIIISVPSSIVVEALSFTDNIIVIPDKNFSSEEGRKILYKRYPFARIVSIENLDAILGMAWELLDNRTTKIPRDPVNIDSVLKDLFIRLEDADVIQESRVLYQ